MSRATHGKPFVTRGSGPANPPVGVNAGDALIWDATAGAWSTQQAEMNYRGFQAWSGPPWGSSTGLATSQSEVAVKVWLPQNKVYTITNLIVAVSTAGSTLTSGQNLCTLYAQDGTKLASTADQTVNWATAGVYLMALTAAQTVQGGVGRYCWVGFLSNGTTPATFRVVTTSNTWANVAGANAGALAGANLLSGRIGAAVTAPASFTPSALAINVGIQYWVGLS